MDSMNRGLLSVLVITFLIFVATNPDSRSWRAVRPSRNGDDAVRGRSYLPVPVPEEISFDSDEDFDSPAPNYSFDHQQSFPESLPFDEESDTSVIHTKSKGILPGQKCNPKVKNPCTFGFTCACNGICVRKVKAKITFVADDAGEMFICGRRIAQTFSWDEKQVIQYTGPCSDIFVRTRNDKRGNAAAVAVEVEGKTYSSGDSLPGVSKSSSFPRNWDKGIPGFDYSKFTPVEHREKLFNYQPYADVLGETGAFPVTDAKDSWSRTIAFRFTTPFCSAPPPAKPGEKCDTRLKTPCTEGFMCGCHGICVRKIEARITFIADDAGEMFICGKKISATTAWYDKEVISYSGPCSDIFVETDNYWHGGATSVAVQIGKQVFASGKSLQGFSATSGIPKGWQLGRPGFSYSMFKPVKKETFLANYPPYSTVVSSLGAYPVTDARNNEAEKIAFRFAAPFCYVQPPAKPGARCDPKLKTPCVKGYSCGCNGICVKIVSAKITFVADDAGELFICGKKIAKTSKWNEKKIINYKGPCSDIFVQTKNRKRGSATAVAVQIGSRIYGSGQSLQAVSRTKGIPTNWEKGIPGFHYAAFTPVKKRIKLAKYKPYSEMIAKLGAYPVTDADNEYASKIAFRFVAKFCF